MKRYAWIAAIVTLASLWYLGWRGIAGYVLGAGAVYFASIYYH